MVFNLKIYNSKDKEAFVENLNILLNDLMIIIILFFFLQGREGIMGPNCTYFLLMLLFYTLLTFAFTGFQARRSVGIFMLVMYAMFILFSMLGESEVLHPFGTDHRNEGEFEMK